MRRISYNSRAEHMHTTQPGGKMMGGALNNVPRWFKPVAIVALLWNLLGCAAFLSDMMLKPEDIASLSAAQQAAYASRPAWAIGATAIAVWGGALGCLGLILRKRWALPLLLLSLIGVIAQDVALFAPGAGAGYVDPTAFVLQGVVLVVAAGLALLSYKAVKAGWIS
jgi:hypothetical protein